MPAINFALLCYTVQILKRAVEPQKRTRLQVSIKVSWLVCCASQITTRCLAAAVASRQLDGRQEALTMGTSPCFYQPLIPWFIATLISFQQGGCRLPRPFKSDL